MGEAEIAAWIGVGLLIAFLCLRVAYNEGRIRQVLESESKDEDRRAGLRLLNNAELDGEVEQQDDPENAELIARIVTLSNALTRAMHHLKIHGDDAACDEVQGIVAASRSVPVDVPLHMLRERIERALEVADSYGSIGGEHHKEWVIDQMVRALTGYVEDYEAGDGNVDEYMKWVADHCAGVDGPDTYRWSTGIAP